MPNLARVANEKDRTWLCRLPHTPRFSLRTGLLLFLVLGTSLGMSARWVQDVRRRGEAQLLLAASSSKFNSVNGEIVRVSYAPELKRSWFVQWVRYAVHPEYDRRFEEIRVVDFSTIDAKATVDLKGLFAVEALIYSGVYSEERLANSLQTNGLRSVTIEGRPASSAGSTSFDKKGPPRLLEKIHVDISKPLSPQFTQWLTRAPNLTQIDLEQVTPEALLHFASPPNLYEMRLNGHQIFRQAMIFPWSKTISNHWQAPLRSFFDELADREKLVRLDLHSLILDDPVALRKFSERSKIETLRLQSCNIAPACVLELSQLSSLEVLELNSTPLKPKDLHALSKMTTLKEITNLWCSDDEAVRELAAALPRCKISRHVK
jgi:hypothetical protein